MILALPTLSESFGLAILEALARRLPVLTNQQKRLGRIFKLKTLDGLLMILLRN